MFPKTQKQGSKLFSKFSKKYLEPQSALPPAMIPMNTANEYQEIQDPSHNQSIAGCDEIKVHD